MSHELGNLHQKRTKALAKVREFNAATLLLESKLAIEREQLAYWNSIYKDLDHELALATKLTKINSKRTPSIKSTKDKISDITKDPALAARILAAIASQNKGVGSGFNGAK